VLKREKATNNMNNTKKRRRQVGVGLSTHLVKDCLNKTIKIKEETKNKQKIEL
jgi:hypothetical protein